MDILCKKEFFNLLIENSSVTNQQIQQAYENLVTEVLTLNQTETDYQTIFRSLNLTRIEFQSLQTQILYEQGEKCPKISLFTERNFSD